MSILDTIFELRVGCYLTHAEKNIVAKEVIIIDDCHTPENGFVDRYGGTWESYSPNEDAIRKSFLHAPSETGDVVSDNEEMETAHPREITVDDMVEIYDGVGIIRFISVPDILKVYKILNEYLVEIDCVSGMRPSAKFCATYVMPPEEDMVKMQQFRDALHGLADALDNDGPKGLGIKRLGGFFQRTASSRNGANGTVSLGGLGGLEITKTTTAEFNNFLSFS